MQEKTEYLFRFLGSHLASAGEFSRLFHLLEETPFLRRQANYFDSFAESSSGLEKHAIPASIYLRDWRRFARHFLTAINLRELARSFADRGMLKAVIAAGRIGFVLDAVEGMGILFRLVARALVARRLEKEEDRYRTLLRKIREDLRILRSPKDESNSDDQFWMLAVVATEVGPEIEEELRELLLDPARQRWSDAVWGSVAEGCLEREGFLSSNVWKYFDEIQDEDLLATGLPNLFAEEEIEDAEDALLRVAALANSDLRTIRLCWAVLVGRHARSAPEEAQREWDRMLEKGLIEWSLELVERTGDLFTSAGVAWTERQLHQVDDPVIAAAVWVAAARSGDPEACARAEVAIGHLSQNPDRVRWTLSLLEALPPADRLSRLRRLAKSLDALRFAVPADDLHRFLDLLAVAFPDLLPRFLEDIIWAPGIGSEILVTLAEKAEDQVLLELLFTNLETYVAALGPSEVQGAWAWKVLVAQIAGRLCALRGDLTYLESALRQSSDGDEVRVTVAKALAEAGHRQLVRETCEGIRAKRLRLRSLFELVPDMACQEYLGDPAALYSSLSEAGNVENTILGLMSLLDVDRSLPSLQQAYLGRMHDENERALTWMRLIRLALDEPERSGWSAQERLQGAESLARAASSLSSDVQLAFLTPDLLEIWGRVARDQICDELRESLSQILRLEEVSPDLREEVIETLLARMGPLLFDSSSAGPVPRTRRREAASLLLWAAEQLARHPELASPENGIGLQPILIAAAGRLPAHALESLGPAGLLRLVETSGGPGAQQNGRVRILFCALREGPREAIAQWLAADDNQPLALVGLIYLLAVLHPDIALEAIDHLNSNPSRDDLCLRLIRHGWLPAQQAFQALLLIEDPTTRLEAELHLGLSTLARKFGHVFVRPPVEGLSQSSF